MKPSFRRLKPHTDNMVAEWEGLNIRVLCVECGWEDTFGNFEENPFWNHNCRLVTEMVSTLD